MLDHSYQINAEILIKDGRHPVVEKLLPGREKFIPNNLSMDSKKIKFT